MSAATSLIRAAPTVPCAPWPRHVLTPEDWRRLAAPPRPAPAPALLGLWAETGYVHALFRDPADGVILPASVPVVGGFYPALSPGHPAASWFERMILDLWGHTAEGGRDLRPWLDHGRWPAQAPLSPRPVPASAPPEPPAFLGTTGGEAHVLPLGPVPDRVAEAAYLRVTLAGATVARAEARLGYMHKGTLGLLRGKSPRAAARFAARLAGDATVAHAIAFARAAEAASGVAVPARAEALRGLMAELERCAAHCAAIAATAEAAGCAPLAAIAQARGEALRRAAAAAFGHRLMMDCVVPGGVAAELAPGGAAALAAALAGLAASWPAMARWGERLAPRLAGIAVTPPALLAAFAVGGVIGRAGGVADDPPCVPGDPAYPGMQVAAPVRTEGDAAARLTLRLADLSRSAGLLETWLAAPAAGAVAVPLPPMSGEGIGGAEGPRGAVWHWLRLDGGMIATCFPRDPGWLQWPLLEAALAGGTVADVPLALASFDARSAGVDL